MKLTLCDDNNDNVMIWDLERQIGDMREPCSRRKLYRELIEAIDFQLKYYPPPPETKSAETRVAPTQATDKEVMDYLASLTQEEREEVVK